MNKEKLYNDIRLTFERVSNEFGFIKPDFGAGYEKIQGSDRYSLHHSQIVTQGVMDNKFEIIPSADCTIMQVEDLWHDLYPLTILMPNETTMSKEDIEKFKKLYPSTYGVQYDKEKVKAKFPENIRDTGWLCFDISDTGFERFKEVLRYIISELLLPELDKYHSIDILDKMINSKVIVSNEDKRIINKHQGLSFRRMILAKLNNNPLFEEISQYYLSNTSQFIEFSKRPGMEYFKNYPYVFEEVYNRLKSITPTAV